MGHKNLLIFLYSIKLTEISLIHHRLRSACTIHSQICHVKKVITLLKLNVNKSILSSRLNLSFFINSGCFDLKGENILVVYAY